MKRDRKKLKSSRKRTRTIKRKKGSSKVKEKTLKKRILAFIKERLANYFASFHLNFIKNALIAGFIFLLLLLLSQFDYNWSQMLLENVYLVSKEGIDYQNITRYWNDINNFVSQ